MSFSRTFQVLENSKKTPKTLIRGPSEACIYLESVDECVSFVVTELAHRSAAEMLRHVSVVLVLHPLRLLLAPNHVRRRLAEVLHDTPQQPR